jgi:hypothetical protein
MTVPVDRPAGAPALFAIRRGCTRLVLLVGPWAVKLPHFLRGWRDGLYGLCGNMNEAERSGAPAACPVLWHIPGGFLLIMRRADALDDEEFAGLDAPALCDPHPALRSAENTASSFGRLPDGRVVCVDYGA